MALAGNKNMLYGFFRFRFLKGRFLMKTIVVGTCIALLSLALVFFYSLSAPVQSRQEIVAEWMGDLKMVAENSGDARINDIFKMLEERAVTAIPTGTGADIIAKEGQSADLKIIPLLPSDGKFEIWKTLVEGDSFTATFIEEIGGLVLKNFEPISPIFKGMVIAHEGNHAFLFLQRKAPLSKEKAYCYEEKDTHELEIRLLSGITQGKYEKVLDKEADRIYKNVAEGKDLGSSVPTPSLVPDSFREMFGPSLSSQEDGIRKTTFWVHSVFRFIDKYYQGNKEEQKTLFLRSAYYSLGLLPQDGLL